MLYYRFKTKHGEKDVFKIARGKEWRTRYLPNVRCIKDDDGKVLMER